MLYVTSTLHTCTNSKNVQFVYPQHKGILISHQRFTRGNFFHTYKYQRRNNKKIIKEHVQLLRVLEKQGKQEKFIAQTIYNHKQPRSERLKKTLHFLIFMPPNVLPMHLLLQQRKIRDSQGIPQLGQWL